jgi:hypothetical protein
MNNQPSKSPKQEIFETTANRVKQYIEQEKAVERILRLHPQLPNQEKEENSANLQKWFSGEIIENSI